MQELQRTVSWDYEFSDKEIREIKSKLPKHLAKIIEMGKVEVKVK